MTRLETIYREKVVPALQKEFAYKSPMQIPGIEKISLNIGLGSANQNQKLIDDCVADLSAIETRQITLGRNDENYIEVLDGLEEGDVVLTQNQASSIFSMMR